MLALLQMSSSARRLRKKKVSSKRIKAQKERKRKAKFCKKMAKMNPKNKKK